MSEIGAFEVNEAFAPVPRACSRNRRDTDLLNPLGGAIALGPRSASRVRS